MTTCTHLDTITVWELPERVAGCEDCLREGTKWLHLRICLVAVHVAAATTRPRNTLRPDYRAGGHP